MSYPIDPASTEDALGMLREQGIRYLHLHFIDILGRLKTVEVPESGFERALSGEVTFVGGALHGAARGDEDELRLVPDLDTLRRVPWSDPAAPMAQAICNVHRMDGTSYEGDPRGSLRRTLDGLAEAELDARIGIDIEFFLLDGTPAAATPRPGAGLLEHDPNDAGERARREIVGALTALGIEVESARRGEAPFQHQVTLAAESPLVAADAVECLRLAARAIAPRHGVRASFMPKPMPGFNGSAMHLRHALYRDEQNIFADGEAMDGLSQTLRHYVGGLLAHARGSCAITNPLVNSYKRLVSEGEPVSVAWSTQGSAPMIRVPAERGEATHCEVRTPDPCANPYLTMAVQLAAGMEGLASEADPGSPLNKSVRGLSERERRRLHVGALPTTLGEALTALEHDRTVRSVLGELIYAHFTEAKHAEFDEYLATVHPWELERYLEW